MAEHCSRSAMPRSTLAQTAPTPFPRHLAVIILLCMGCAFTGNHVAARVAFDDGAGVLLAIFMASPTLQTLPVKIWSTLRQDLTPVIAAASTLLIAFTILLMVVAAFFRKGRKT